MSSVTLQNNIRLRVILVISLSLFVQFGRNFVSDSVHKATDLLEINYIFYGLLLLCSCIPSKIAWYVAAIGTLLATLLSALALALGGIATSRCLDNSGCIQTIFPSLLVLAAVALQCLLDLYQTWNIYIILRTPYFIASSTQRLVILFSWTLPFAILTNIVLFMESAWSVWASPPLVAMPIIIIMAQAAVVDSLLLGVLIAISMTSNMVALLTQIELAHTALMIQAAISAFGTLVLFLPSEKYIQPPPPAAPTVEQSPILPTVSTLEVQKLRQRKSKILKF